jgi:leucyl-tRNA synthetase
MRNQGQILGPDGQRMSKSRGNVIDPGEQVQAYGADTVRAYLMFGYRWAEGGPWNPSNIQGVVRWLNRVWSLVVEAPPGSVASDRDAARLLRRRTHQAIRRISNDLERFEFNTVISTLMELTNAIADARDAGLAASSEFGESVRSLLLLMAPVAPHLAEELWARLGLPYSVHNQSWPTFDAELAREEEITLVVQVNGKVRDRITVSAGIGEAEARRLALESEAVRKVLAGKAPRQVIVVPGRLVNIVI